MRFKPNRVDDGLFERDLNQVMEYALDSAEGDNEQAMEMVFLPHSERGGSTAVELLRRGQLHMALKLVREIAEFKAHQAKPREIDPKLIDGKAFGNGKR